MTRRELFKLIAGAFAARFIPKPKSFPGTWFGFDRSEKAFWRSQYTPMSAKGYLTLEQGAEQYIVALKNLYLANPRSCVIIDDIGTTKDGSGRIRK